MQELPIAEPTTEIRTEVEAKVSQLLQWTKERQSVIQSVVKLLAEEFKVDKIGQKLEGFWLLNQNQFLQEIKSKRLRGLPEISLQEIERLGEMHTKQSAYMNNINEKMAALEQQIADLINVAYGLSSEEISLLWKTAPPRMPISPPEDFRE